MENFPKNFREKPSVMFSILTKEDYEKNTNLIGPRGYTFDQAIQCGLCYIYAFCKTVQIRICFVFAKTCLLTLYYTKGLDGKGRTGVAIPDEESYYLWRGFYDKVIEARHNFVPDAIHKSDLDYTKIDARKLPADLNDFCVSTRISATRNISGFGLAPSITRSERREVSRIIQTSLSGLTGDLEGKYYSLETLSKEDSESLRADHFLFQIPNNNAMIHASGGCRDWPESRGIFHNKGKTFAVWVNEEDQVRVISLQQGGDVKKVFVRWCIGVNEVEKSMKAIGRTWMQNQHVGNFSSCVCNIGTGLRASMLIKIPNILKQIGQDRLKDFCASMRIDCQASGSENTTIGSDGKVDISNYDRIGKSEVELVQILVDGVIKLIDVEKKAKDGTDIKPLLSD